MQLNINSVGGAPVEIFVFRDSSVYLNEQFLAALPTIYSSFPLHHLPAANKVKSLLSQYYYFCKKI